MRKWGEAKKKRVKIWGLQVRDKDAPGGWEHLAIGIGKEGLHRLQTIYLKAARKLYGKKAGFRII